MLHQVNGSHGVGFGHVWPYHLDGLNSKHGLAKVFPTGCLGFPKGISDNVLKIQVHAAQPRLGMGHRYAMGHLRIIRE